MDAAYHSHPLRALVLGLLLSLLAAPLAMGEEFTWPLSGPGLGKGDLTDLELLECTIGGGACAILSTASLTVTDEGAAGGLYKFAGLPDAAAGSGTYYSLYWIENSKVGVWLWPRGTVTPQAVTDTVSYRVPPTITLAAGDTLPSASLDVAGLSSDPTGSTVVFDLWKSGGAQVLDGVSAAISDIDLQADGTWAATLTHSWIVAETTGLSGSYYGRFVVTFPGGAIMTLPPAPQILRVQVHP